MFFESWSVDEHDPLAIQLKLVGGSDSVVPSCPQARPTSVVDELQLQSLESENRSERLPFYRGFSRQHTSYHPRPKDWLSQTLYRR